MMRSTFGCLPSPTTRLLMSRTTSATSLLSVVAIGTRSFRDGARAPDPKSRDSGFDASHRPGMTADNDVRSPSLPTLALLQAGIERVAGGVADQVDAQDRDRQQQPRPEDQ